MQKTIRIVDSPSSLNSAWDDLANFYFQKREFLFHLHRYNHCKQSYYELYYNGILVSGAVVYTLVIDLFTFSGIKSPVSMRVIGLPASIACEPLIGDPHTFGFLLQEIIRTERGFIVGINFLRDYLSSKKVVALRTLPTVILKPEAVDMAAYGKALRHPYRRRMRRVQERFNGVCAVRSDCSGFSEAHYALYLQIMDRTRTKLETLSFECFRNLPANFLLTTYYDGSKMLCWHVVCLDGDVLFFFFGGMSYSLQQRYASYYNSLFGILSLALEKGYKEIDFGQTAETAKMYLGGMLSERRLFLYHRNPLILLLIRLFRRFIGYRRYTAGYKVFKNRDIHQ